jgi:hypothetical protein
VRPSRDRAAAKLARRAIDRARRGVEQRRDAATDDGIALHDLRIAYKELRYAAEILGDALPADLAAMREPASKFQKRLGEIHDADMALLAVKRARGLDDVTRGAVLASLDALREKRVAKYMAEMAPAAEPPSPVVIPRSEATRDPPANRGLPRFARNDDNGEARDGSAAHGKLKPSAASRSGRSPAS